MQTIAKLACTTSLRFSCFSSASVSPRDEQPGLRVEQTGLM
jgi:hypothetical protein